MRKAYRKADQKEPKNKRCLLTLDLNPSNQRSKESISQAAVLRKKLITDIVGFSKCERIMKPMRITCRPSTRIRRWN